MHLTRTYFALRPEIFEFGNEFIFKIKAEVPVGHPRTWYYNSTRDISSSYELVIPKITDHEMEKFADISGFV